MVCDRKDNIFVFENIVRIVLESCTKRLAPPTLKLRRAGVPTDLSDVAQRAKLEALA